MALKCFVLLTFVYDIIWGLAEESILVFWTVSLHLSSYPKKIMFKYKVNMKDRKNCFTSPSKKFRHCYPKLGVSVVLKVSLVKLTYIVKKMFCFNDEAISQKHYSVVFKTVKYDIMRVN